MLFDGIRAIDNQQGIRHIVQLFSIGVVTDLDSGFLCLNLHCVSRVDDLEFGIGCVLFLRGRYVDAQQRHK